MPRLPRPNWPKQEPDPVEIARTITPSEATVGISELAQEFTEPPKLQGRPVRPQGRSQVDRKIAQYGDVLPEALLARFSGFLNDEDYLSLTNEIATVRTLFLHMLTKWQQYEQLWSETEYDDEGNLKELPKPPFKVSELLGAADSVSKLVERQHRILYSDANLITVEAAVAFSLMVAQIVNTFVKDADERDACLGAIRRLLTQGRSFSVSGEVSRRLLSPLPVGTTGLNPND